MTLNAKIESFVDFLAISGCDTSLCHSQSGATELSLAYAIQVETQFSAKLLNRNCYRLSRVLWALAQFLVFLLGTKVPGDESSWERRFHESVYRQIFFICNLPEYRTKAWWRTVWGCRTYDCEVVASISRSGHHKWLVLGFWTGDSLRTGKPSTYEL